MESSVSFNGAKRFLFFSCRVGINAPGDAEIQPEARNNFFKKAGLV